MPLDRQKQVVDDIKARLDPPPGVEASVVGLPVLVAEANGALSSPWRRGLTLVAALAGVFLVLLAVRRSARQAAVPLIPIALATGWSGGVLFLLGLLPGSLEVDLNPMSVTLGALVIAISTEFSVLLSARYAQERAAGAGPARAIELTYASTGTAVLASGATAIAGFAALIASDIRMLRDFGIVTVVDLTVSLLGVLIVLPAALIWAEQHGPFRARDLDPRRLRGLRRTRTQRARTRNERGPLRGPAQRRAAPRRHRRAARRARSNPPGARPAARGAAPRQQVRLARRDPDADGAHDRAVPADAAQRGLGDRRPQAGQQAEGVRRPVRARRPGGRRERLPARAAVLRSGGQGPGLRPGVAAGREPLPAAPQAARADVHLRPRRRLLPAGRPHRAREAEPAGRQLRDALLHAQGARAGAQAGGGARLAPAGRRSTATARSPTCTGSAAARRPCSRAPAGACATTKLGNLTEDELRTRAKRLEG